MNVLPSSPGSAVPGYLTTPSFRASSMSSSMDVQSVSMVLVSTSVIGMFLPIEGIMMRLSGGVIVRSSSGNCCFCSIGSLLRTMSSCSGGSVDSAGSVCCAKRFS